MGDIAKKYPTYLPHHYLEEFKMKGFILKKAVYVEAISDDYLAEAKWADALFRPSPVEFALVAYAPLQDPDVDKTLSEYAKLPSVRGIRQILNHHPTNPALTWPGVTEDLLDNPRWAQGYARLARHGFSFDLQLNPHQMPKAARLLAAFPGTPVVVDHLGCLFLDPARPEGAAEAAWREGMAALARLPHVYVKISMLGFSAADWAVSAPGRRRVRGWVAETIGLFGAERCMFASNFPVDLPGVGSAQKLYEAFEELVSDLSPKQKSQLFYQTAKSFYRFNDANL
uniref:Amidohydrolase-related domain-containing protein n=1 Tax=Arcella intermedia TaxID=1963864 RepID=A0A6B2LB40_9EUKA